MRMGMRMGATPLPPLLTQWQDDWGVWHPLIYTDEVYNEYRRARRQDADSAECVLQ